MKNIFKYLLFSFLVMTFFSCNNHTIIKFTIDKNIDIKNKNGTITVYGHNEYMADVSADVIHIQKFTIDQFPIKITLKIPSDARDKIKHLSNPEDARFYLSFDWDSNGDGRDAAGDISFDYDKKFPTVLLGTSNEIPLRVRTE